jgi:endoglucanase
VPFSCELALNLDARRPTNINYGANPQLEGMTSGAVLDYLVAECAKRGIVILLDMHRMEAAGDIPELWYSAKHPESAVATAWRLMARRYAPCWNVIGADLNNEPHGCAIWEPGDGTNLATNWRAAAERLGRVVLEANPRLLVFVEGVERCTSTGDGSWWGGHIGDAASAPVVLPVKDKLVYSPHVYGPDVHEQVYFGSANFEQYLPKIWNEHFGFAALPKGKGARPLGPAVVPGEWGGFARAGTKDAVWQEAFARWMAGDDTSGIESSFHWCWQCNSGDTGELFFLSGIWVLGGSAPLLAFCA